MSASTLGTSVPQVNARSKVLGRAQYTGDLKLPGMLHAKVLRSPYAHARIVSIDVSAALALPGVKAVITGDDGPQVPWGVHKKERLTFARGVVRFAGEEVAAVAAVTEEIARDALDLIRVAYEELPAILTPDEASDPDAPAIHPGRSDNVAHDIAYERGDVDTAFAQAHLVHEATYTTHAQYPGYMEPMATVATVDADGRLQVWTSTHSAHLVRARLAAVLSLPVSQVRVIQATTGGGFGGKMIEDANSLVAGALAMRTRRPVRVVNNRLEDFVAAPSSVPERITLKLGMDRTGRIVAKDLRILADCGAYSGLAPEVMHVSAMRSDNMHRNPNVRSHATMVYTHTPPHGAFRGFGGTQVQFALNSHIDVMARKLDLDPLAVHRLNAIEAGETSVHGWKIGSTGMQDCLTQCVEAIGWSAKRGRPGHGVKRRGVGIAAAMHVSGNRTIGNWDGSTVMVKISEDGRAIIHSGEADVGQGAQTVLCQAVAHELDIPLAHVHITLPDTDSSPWAIGTLASRVTIAGGHAAMRAGQAAREKLIAQAALMLQVEVESLECAEGTVRVKADPSRKLTLAELARNHIWRHGGEGIQVTGSWDARTEMFDKTTIMGNISPAYSFAAQAVEVEVDTETGQVTLIDSFVSDDCGKAFNPQAVHGQSNGAAAQAIGWTLYEQLQLDNGRIVNGNFADYTMPTADALPELRSGIVESIDPNGPYGAKGASETAILPGAGAIANAVFDAVGVRITDLPITPEKVLAGLRRLREGEARHA
jgi:CO/xanthine dehydrogenase Mo-binding subunit